MNKQFNTQTSMAPTETTRYFCAAAYLDSRFRNYVMEHIVHEEHRAIVISCDVDLVPVIRYCLAAKKRELLYNSVLSALLFASIIFCFVDPLSLLLFLLLAWMVAMIEVSSRYYGNTVSKLVKGKFHLNNLQHPLDLELEIKLRDLSNTQNHNVIVYSGYSPFIGAGQNIGGWSFTVDIAKGKVQGTERALPEVFQLTELYDSLSDNLMSLSIEGLSLEDKLLVSGQEIRDDERFLASHYARPKVQVDPHLVREISERPTRNIRYYKCVQVTSWEGGLVLSIFLRFSKVGKNLFVEANSSILTPIREEYQQIDVLTSSRKRRSEIAQQLFACFWLFPFRMLVSPFALLGRWIDTWMREQKEEEIKSEIDENPRFDYGAFISLRELVGSQRYQRYFQHLDKEMYLKVIQSQILDSIVEFLDKKNIDTTDLKERQEVILNNGVIVSGGEFKADNVAVGERARALFSNVTNTATRA
jgi:hypothetical protein